MDIAEIEARLEIQDLIAKYVQYADTGKADEQAALFAEDGVLGEVRGRANIAEYLRGLKTMFSATPSAGSAGLRHHVSSVNITVEGPDAARATAYYLVLRAHGLDHWGVYRDRYVRTDGEWRFAERQSRLGGAVAGSAVVEPPPR